MYKISIPTLISLIFITIASAESDLDSVSFATYYPAPYGVYHEMRTDQQSIGTGYRSNTVPTNSLIVEGSVGVGTYDPQAKLDVNGAVKINGNTNIQGNLAVTSNINSANLTGDTLNINHICLSGTCIDTWPTPAPSPETEPGLQTYQCPDWTGMGNVCPQVMDVGGKHRLIRRVTELGMIRICFVNLGKCHARRSHNV